MLEGYPKLVCTVLYYEFFCPPKESMSISIFCSSLDILWSDVSGKYGFNAFAKSTFAFFASANKESSSSLLLMSAFSCFACPACPIERRIVLIKELELIHKGLTLRYLYFIGSVSFNHG